LPSGFAERRGGIGTRQDDAHQADVFGSRQRYLHGDADFARVECDAFGDELGLRIARVVTKTVARIERGLPQVRKQDARAWQIRLRGENGAVAGHPVGKDAGGGLPAPFNSTD